MSITNAQIALALAVYILMGLFVLGRINDGFEINLRRLVWALIAGWVIIPAWILWRIWVIVTKFIAWLFHLYP